MARDLASRTGHLPALTPRRWSRSADPATGRIEQVTDQMSLSIGQVGGVGTTMMVLADRLSGTNGWRT